MSSIVKSLVKATGCKAKTGEDRQAYLVRLVTAVSELPEDDWAKLPEDSQDWVNEAITAIKAKTDVDDPDAEEVPAVAAEAEDDEEAPKPKKAAKAAKPAKKAPAEESDDEDEEAPKAKPAKKAVKAEVEDDDEEADEDEAEEAPKAKAAKKAPVTTKSGDADKFRLAYIKVLVKGKDTKPQELVRKLELSLSDNYVTGMAYDLRKTVDAMRKANLLADAE